LGKLEFVDQVKEALLLVGEVLVHQRCADREWIFGPAPLSAEMNSEQPSKCYKLCRHPHSSSKRLIVCGSWRKGNTCQGKIACGGLYVTSNVLFSLMLRHCLPGCSAHCGDKYCSACCGVAACPLAVVEARPRGRSSELSLCKPSPSRPITNRTLPPQN